MGYQHCLELKNEIAKRRERFKNVGYYGSYPTMLSNLSLDHSLAAKSFSKLIKNYIEEMENLLKEESESVNPNKEAIREIIVFFYKVSLDPNYEAKENVLHNLGDYYYLTKADLLSEDEEVVLLAAIVNLYRIFSRPWRGKKFAKILKGKLEKSCDLPEIFENLSEFYVTVMDYRSAHEVALAGANKFYSAKGKLKASAHLYRSALAYSLYLNEAVPSDDEIREKYGKEADFILQYENYAAIKYDPIMNEERFQEVYDEVMEEAMDAFEEHGPQVIFQLWGLMEDGFASRGLVWKSPALMNPNMCFD
ncbi:MAG: hypothetical protein K5694_00930 [Bacilli bacterium]|nr:hypothetical protein [Bacilli bacterium]